MYIHKLKPATRRTHNNRHAMRLLLRQLVLARLGEFLAAVEEDERQGVPYWKEKQTEEAFQDFLSASTPAYLKA